MKDLQVYQNDQFGTIRIVEREGEPWFVAADICRAPEIGDTQSALRRLHDDEKGKDSIRTLGGEQEMLVVSEPGLYALVLGSRKSEAEAFQRWVSHARCELKSIERNLVSQRWLKSMFDFV